MPEAVIPALEINGFCKLLVKPFGPVHVYATLPVVEVLAVNFKVSPLQIGLLLLAAGNAGVGLITTSTVPAAEVQPFILTVTLYEPDAAMVTFGIFGF